MEDILSLFVPHRQLAALMVDEPKFEHIATAISKLPMPYGTDGQGADAIAQLHYVNGDSQWFILERDSTTRQIQAFGLTVLDGDLVNMELGYIDVEELLLTGVQLDLEFVPKSLREVKAELYQNHWS